MTRPKLEQHHALLMEQLARDAELIARSPAVSKEQRAVCKGEARSFNEIALNIRAQLAK